MNYEQQKTAYQNNALFKKLVDVIYHSLLLRGECTPDEVTGAVNLAKCMYAKERNRRKEEGNE